MGYTIAQMSKLSGVTPRTLRHYEDVGLLAPARAASTYRHYNAADVDRLQQILFYRELGFSLEEIARILLNPDFDEMSALHTHLRALEAKKLHLDGLITTVLHTIEQREGTREMSDKDKFESFKQDALKKNEERYGEEIRSNYGEDTVKASNKKWLNMSQEEHEAMSTLSAEILDDLKKAVLASVDPASETGIAIGRKHRQWLTFTWPTYSTEAHKGLGQMYTADPRFTKFYDSEVEGCAAFLRDAIVAYTETL